MIVDRLAYAGLVLLALSLGLGDIAQVTLLDGVVLSAVRALLVVGLVEASGAPLVGGWIAVLHDGPIPIGDVPRITSTLSHPNEAAMLLELSLPLLVAWAWTAPQPWRTLLSMAVPGVLLGIVLTFSRAGVAAALAALAVMAGVSSRCQERGYVRPLATAAL